MPHAADPRHALIVIDPQNDYFPGGAFPLWNTEAALAAMLQAVSRAQAAGIPIVYVQHIADPAGGIAPLFNAGTEGAALHPALLAAAGDAHVLIKHRADSFRGTGLQALLHTHAVDSLLLCGMMTQNCVTHTALSETANGYRVQVLADACTTVSAPLHAIALHALGDRVSLTTVAAALPG